MSVALMQELLERDVALIFLIDEELVEQAHASHSRCKLHRLTLRRFTWSERQRLQYVP